MWSQATYQASAYGVLCGCAVPWQGCVDMYLALLASFVSGSHFRLNSIGFSLEIVSMRSNSYNSKLNLSMASRPLRCSSGAQASLACKIRTPLPPPLMTIIRQSQNTNCASFQPPHNTIRSYRRYTTQNQNHHQDPLRQLPVSGKNQKASGPAPRRQSVLDRMGATRNVKIAVIVFLCIYGTMETIFYAGVLYRYFTKPEPTGKTD